MAWVLRATDVFGPTRWRWLLEDAGGRAVADHEVNLAPTSVEHEALCDLDGNAADNWVASEATIVARIGDQVLGPAIGAAIVAGDEDTARIDVPADADFLLDRPLKLAHADGVPGAATAGETLHWFKLPDHADDLTSLSRRCCEPACG